MDIQHKITDTAIWDLDNADQQWIASLAVLKDGDKLNGATVVIPISFVDTLLTDPRGYHHPTKLKAIVDMLNAHVGAFDKVVLLVADELQALNERDFDKINDEQHLQALRDKKHEVAKLWAKKAVIKIFSKLNSKISFEMLFWRDLIGHPYDEVGCAQRQVYQQYKDHLETLRQSDVDLAEAVVQSTFKQFSKYVKKQPKQTMLDEGQKQRLKNIFGDYPVEETAVVELLAEKRIGAFTILYPDEMNPLLLFLRSNHARLALDTSKIGNKPHFKSFVVKYRAAERVNGFALRDSGDSETEEAGSGGVSPKHYKRSHPPTANNSSNSSEEYEASPMSISPPGNDVMAVQTTFGALEILESLPDKERPRFIGLLRTINGLSPQAQQMLVQAAEQKAEMLTKKKRSNSSTEMKTLVRERDLAMRGGEAPRRRGSSLGDGTPGDSKNDSEIIPEDSVSDVGLNGPTIISGRKK